MDVLLTHGYYLYEDPHELAVMKPYPPLGLLYVSSHLKARGFDVSVFDTTFARPAELQSYLRKERPPAVGIYSNLMTRREVLRTIQVAHEVGSKVVAGGPDPANYLDEYLSRGVDVIVIGEGELTLEDLLARDFKDLAEVPGIAFRDADGKIV